LGNNKDHFRKSVEFFYIYIYIYIYILKRAGHPTLRPLFRKSVEFF